MGVTPPDQEILITRLPVIRFGLNRYGFEYLLRLIYLAWFQALKKCKNADFRSGGDPPGGSSRGSSRGIPQGGPGGWPLEGPLGPPGNRRNPQEPAGTLQKPPRNPQEPPIGTSPGIIPGRSKNRLAFLGIIRRGASPGIIPRRPPRRPQGTPRRSPGETRQFLDLPGIVRIYDEI